MNVQQVGWRDGDVGCMRKCDIYTIGVHVCEGGLHEREHRSRVVPPCQPILNERAQASETISNPT